jgi:hypothetical protein
LRQKKVAAIKGFHYGDHRNGAGHRQPPTVVVEEFYNPVMKSGLLETHHINGIFLNIEDLAVNSTVFLEVAGRQERSTSARR